MELLFEFILELALEGCIEASKSKRIPKYVKYPLIVLISLFFTAVIGLVFFAGVLILKESVPAGALFILVGLFMLAACVIKFRKTYMDKRKKK